MVSEHGAFHYTAWSAHRDLRTAADLWPRCPGGSDWEDSDRHLHRRHLPLLNELLLEGRKAVLAAHPDLRRTQNL